MYNWKVISVLLVSLLAAGCTTTPKLGYPVDLVTRPAKVTLFSTIVKKGIFKYQLDIISRGLWDLFNKKTYEEVLGQISPGPFQEMLNNLFIKEAFSTTHLFILSPAQVFNWDIEYLKSEEDQKEYSGFDFSLYEESIPAPYILALTINEWGLIIRKKSDGNSSSLPYAPYILLSIQLIEKETNTSLWEYKDIFQEVDQEESTRITPEYLKEAYQALIKKAVNKFFFELKKT